MALYPQALYSPARVQPESVTLAPPLKCVWSIEAAPFNPVIGAKSVFAVFESPTRHLAALRISGEKRWEVEGSFYGEMFVYGDQLVAIEAFTETKPSDAIVLRQSTGKVELREPTDLKFATFLSEEKAIIGFTDTGFKMARLEGGLPMVWHTNLVARGQPSRFHFDIACSSREIFIGHDEELVAIRRRDGAELWRSHLRETGGRPTLGFNPMVAGNRIVVTTHGPTGAFDTRTGKLAWTVSGLGHRSIYKNRVYLSRRSGIAVIDLSSGKVIRELPVFDSINQKLDYQIEKFNTHLLVTDTHIFAGDRVGTLWAMDRQTGEAVWWHEPENTTGFLSAIPVPAGNRLYIASQTTEEEPCYLYCYEQGNGPLKLSVPEVASESPPRKTAKSKLGRKK